MLQLSSKDLRVNYDAGKIMLIRANFSTRDAQGNITRHMTRPEIEAKMGELKEDEITQGYLWTEATISPTKQVIQFSLVDTQQISGSPVTPTMRLLTMQDSFLVASMSYFLENYTYDGSQANPNFTTGNSWAPLTYSSPWASNGINHDLDPGCDMFWIGAYLSLEVNKKVLIPYWDCYRHYQAPQTQATPAFPIPSNYIPEQSNQHDGSVDGFYPVEPNVVIGGGRGNILKLNLAVNVPATISPFNLPGYGGTGTAAFVIKAVVCTRGILMQNSTSVK